MDWSKHLRIRQAAVIVERGGVIAYPTESVWGLGCDPNNQQAVARLLALKSRPVEKGLILVAATHEQFAPLLQGLPDKAINQLNAAWPGPVTFLVPHNNLVPSWITGRHTKVALRVSNHPVVRGLCLALGRPLVSTSANPSGKPAATNPISVARYFYGSVDMITPGSTQALSKPTEIRDLLTGEILRPG